MSLREYWRSTLPPRATRYLMPLNRLVRSRRAVNEAKIRALCNTAYLGDDTALCRVLGRFKMFVDTKDIGFSSHMLLDGYWEMWLTEALVEMVRPGMTAIDVGSNLGYFSLVMVDLVGETGKVAAFEANRQIADRARRTASLNGFANRLTVHDQALGDVENGVYRLVLPAGEPKNAYLLPEPDADLSDEAILTTRRLDSYPELLDADIIKIDADTSEEAIWRGMRGILDRGRSITIFLEFAAARYADPEGFLLSIEQTGLSLSLLTLAEGVKSMTRQEILGLPPFEDQMLVLRR